MATTTLMIQLLTEQVLDQLVSEVYPIEDEAFLFLDPSKNTVIREIATVEYGGILATGFPSALSVGVTNKAFASVSLLSARGKAETIFYAPSHVPSPPVAGAGLAILTIQELGVTVDSPAKLSVSRRVGAHVYVDQTD